MNVSRGMRDRVHRHRRGNGILALFLVWMLVLPPFGSSGAVAAQDDALAQATPIADPVGDDGTGGKGNDGTGGKGNDDTAFQAFASSFSGTITIEPAAATVAPGGSATFTVTIAGTVSGVSGTEALLTFETAWPFPNGVTSFQPGSSCDSTPAWNDETGINSGWWWLDVYCYTSTTGAVNATFSVTGIVPDVTDEYPIDSTLYLGDYDTELVTLTEYAVLTVEGDSPVSISVSPAQSTVAPSSSVTFTVSIDLTLGEQHTVYVELLWPFTGAPSSATNADPPCSTSPYSGVENAKQYWYDVICTTDGNGDLEYSFDVTGRVPDVAGDYDVTVTVYDEEWGGDILKGWEELATVTVDDTLTVPGDYTLSITPETSTAASGGPVSFGVQASGTLTTSGGDPIYPGTVYLQVAVPFYGNSANLPDGCTLDRQLAADPYAWFNLSCAVGAGGVFDYSFTITGTAPATTDIYGIAAGLYENEWFGDHVLVEHATIANLTVSDTAPPTGGPTISIVQSPSGEVDPDDAVSFLVTYSGTIHSGGLSAAITTTWPWPIPLDGSLSGNCASPSTGTDNATFWSLTVMCPGPVDGGPFSFSYTLSGIAPEEAGNYPIAADLTYFSDESEVIEYQLDPQVVLKVAGTGDTEPDPYVFAVSPETRNALPGEEITYTVSFKGTLLDEDSQPQPNHQFYLVTDQPFDWLNGSGGATANTVNADTGGACSVSHSGFKETSRWWFDVTCTTDADGHFDYSFTVTGIAPPDLGDYPVTLALYDEQPGPFYVLPVVDTATYATLTVIEAQVGTYTIGATPAELVVTPGGNASFDVSLSGTLIDGYGDPVANGRVALFTTWPFEPTIGNLPVGCTNTPFGAIQLETICDTNAAGEFNYTFTVTGPAPVGPGVSGIGGQLHLNTMNGPELTGYRQLADLVVRGVVPGTELTISPSLVAAAIGDEVPFTAHFVGNATPGEVLTLTLDHGSFGTEAGTWSCAAIAGSCTPPAAGEFRTVSTSVTADPETGAYDVSLHFAVTLPEWATAGELRDFRVSALDASETVLAGAVGTIAVISDDTAQGLQVAIDPASVQDLPGSTHAFTVEISGEGLGEDSQDVGVQIPEELAGSVADVICAPVAGSGTCTAPAAEWAYANGKIWKTTVTPDANGDLHVQVTFSVTLPADAHHGDTFTILAAPGPYAGNFAIATLTIAIPGSASFTVTTGDAAVIPAGGMICLSGNGLADDLCLEIPVSGDDVLFADLPAGTYAYTVNPGVNSGFRVVTGSITVPPGGTAGESVVLQPGIVLALAPSTATVAPGVTVPMTVTLTLQSVIANADLILGVPAGFGIDSGTIALACAAPAVCDPVVIDPAGSTATVHIASAATGIISLIVPVIVPDDTDNGDYSVNASLTLPASSPIAADPALLAVDRSLLPPTTGGVQVTLRTSDDGDIPDGAEVCIGSSCEIVGENSGDNVQSAAPSPVQLTFDAVAGGVQLVTVRGAAPYQDYTGNVGVVAGSSITLELLLQLPDAPPVNTPTPPVNTPTPSGTVSTPTPPAGTDPTVTPTIPDGMTPTATIPVGVPDGHTPGATQPAGEPQATATQGVTQLPNTGAGAPGAASWLLLVAGMVLLFGAAVHVRRRA